MEYSFKDIIDLNNLPLEDKLEITKEVIEKALDLSVSCAAVAFSGGKDSLVLLHIIKKFFPEQFKTVHTIFGNTGCEFPESFKFAKDIGNKWCGKNFHITKLSRTDKEDLKYDAQREVLEWLRAENRLGEILKEDGKLKNTQILYKKCTPEMIEDFRQRKLIWPKGSVKNILWCQDQYGYPILGKAFSKLKARRINIDCFLEFSETQSEKPELKEYYDILRQVKISQACCDILKKEPSERIQSELKVDVLFKGLLADESHTRKVNFATRGFIFKSKQKYLTTPFYHVNPLSHWTDDDIWAYIKKYRVPRPPLYNKTYKIYNKDGDVIEVRNIKRNGCIGCFTDYGRKYSHMYVLNQTHPKIWKWVMNHGMSEQIVKLKLSDSRFQDDIIDGLSAYMFEDSEGDAQKRREWLDFYYKTRPCFFGS